jgi:DHA3 family tetracycline resistance protein-like MFS transporter
MLVRKWDATRVFLLMSGLTSLGFTFAVTLNMVYQVQTVGLSPLQLVLVGTTLELSIFLFEIPTGVVADVYSRRLSILIGFALIGAGLIVEGLVPHFTAILLGQVLWGVGYTFTSGATEAWITDEVGEERVGPVFLRASQVGSLLGLVGALIATALGSLVINLPIVLGGLLFVLTTVLLSLVMPENGFSPTPAAERESWRQMADTLRGGVRLVRTRPALLIILGIGLFFGLYSEGYDRLSTKHLLESFTLPALGDFQPATWVGLMSVVGSLLSIAATQWVIKRVDMTQTGAIARASYWLTGLLVAGLIAFGLASSFGMALVCIWVIGVLRTLIGPLQATWINQDLDSKVRATVISMSGQVDAFGQIVGGPPVGGLGNVSVRAALVASGLILSPTLLLYAWALRWENRAVVAENAEVA